MYQERVELYKKLESAYNSKVLAYITSDRNNMATQIASDVIDPVLICIITILNNKLLL